MFLPSQDALDTQEISTWDSGQLQGGDTQVGSVGIPGEGHHHAKEWGEPEILCGPKVATPANDVHFR